MKDTHGGVCHQRLLHVFFLLCWWGGKMFILQLAIIILATKLAGQLSMKLGQPSVLGKILVGIIIGPALLGWVQETELVTVFSQIGVLLLMFLAGLETNLKDLNENKKSAIFVAIGGILVPIVMSYLAGQYYNFPREESIFIGLLLSATSVSISVQVLKELGWLKSREGSALLGAAILDDIMVVILIAIAMSMFVGVDTNIPLWIGKMILFFVIIVFVSKWLVPKFIQILSKYKITEAVVSAGLIICFSFAYFAEYVGVAGIIGTFFAGLAIAQTDYVQEIEKKVQPIAYGVFMPFFFVSIGLSVSFKGIGNQIGFMIVFSIIAILSKFIGSGLGARLTGFDTKSSMGIGAGMVSRGEVALILATLGLESGLLRNEYYTSMIIVILVTTLITPPLLKVIFGTKK